MPAHESVLCRVDLADSLVDDAVASIDFEQSSTVDRAVELVGVLGRDLEIPQRCNDKCRALDGCGVFSDIELVGGVEAAQYSCIGHRDSGHSRVVDGARVPPVLGRVLQQGRVPLRHERIALPQRDSQVDSLLQESVRAHPSRHRSQRGDGTRASRRSGHADSSTQSYTDEVDLTLGTGLRPSSSHNGLDTFVEIRGGVRSDIPPIRQRLIRLARIRVERDDMRVSEMHIAVHREHLICPLLGSRNFDDSAQRVSRSTSDSHRSHLLTVHFDRR